SNKATQKRQSISLRTKLQVLKKMDAGASFKSIMAHLGISRISCYGIKCDKEKLMSLATNTETNAGIQDRKRMHTSQDPRLDTAIYMWYTPQASTSMPVHSTELQKVAISLNSKIKMHDTGSELTFLFQEEVCNKKVCSETLSADNAAVKPSNIQFRSWVQDGNGKLKHLYNADELGIFWKSLPTNTQRRQNEAEAKDRKAAQERLSALFCANTSGSQRLKLAVMGKSKKLCVLKDYINIFPVHYPEVCIWFDSHIFRQWFKEDFVPPGCCHLNSTGLETKTLLLANSSPAHSNDGTLESDDG
uniref:DDE-1 domain-containing protein n=1 Tax=Latimeria chalumnae TaxID=7897 RepID=H3B915_LATCH